MKNFRLAPYESTKSNTPNDWNMLYIPKGRVKKVEVAKKFLFMYPEVKIHKIHVVKGKKVRIVLSTDRPCKW